MVTVDFIVFICYSLYLFKWFILNLYCVFAFTSGVDPVLNCSVKQVAPEHSVGSCLGMCWGAWKSSAMSQLHGLKSSSSPQFRHNQLSVHSSGAESRLPTALILVSSAFQSGKGAHFSFVELQPRAPNMWLEPLNFRDSLCPCISFSSESPPRDPRLLLFISYLILYVASYSRSDSLQLVSSENCSTCRCIFNMFMEGGDLHILLLPS